MVFKRKIISLVIMISVPDLLPLLFATVPQYHHEMFHTLRFPNTPEERVIHYIHSPRRILQRISGLTLVPNSTTPPVRTSSSSVVMAFDVLTLDGNKWNARMMSSGKDECDVFLMDSVTLQRRAMARIRVERNKGAVGGNHGHTVAASLTVFDINNLVVLQGCLHWFGLATLHRWMQCQYNIMHSRSLIQKRELKLHRLYRAMVSDEEIFPVDRAARDRGKAFLK